jgi:hypothetical protein
MGGDVAHFTGETEKSVVNCCRVLCECDLYALLEKTVGESSGKLFGSLFERTICGVVYFVRLILEKSEAACFRLRREWACLDLRLTCLCGTPKLEFTRFSGDPNYSGEPITCTEATGLRERSRSGRQTKTEDGSVRPH